MRIKMEQEELYTLEIEQLRIQFQDYEVYKQAREELWFRIPVGRIPLKFLFRAETVFDKVRGVYIKHRYLPVDEDNRMVGYHTKQITSGVYGEISKIEEELEELKDAASQSNKIMELVEISDLYGAIEAYVKNKFAMDMNDIKVMSDATKRAFESGQRKSK